MVSIDVTALGATAYKEAKEWRKEQQEWHQSEVDQRVLSRLTPIDFATQQNDFISRRQEGTRRWLLDLGEF